MGETQSKREYSKIDTQKDVRTPQVSDTLQRALIGYQTGDPKSIWIIANHFLYGGDGVSVNKDKALILLERLAQMGHAGACVLLVKESIAKNRASSLANIGQWEKYVTLALNNVETCSFDDEGYGYHQRAFRTKLTLLFDDLHLAMSHLK